MGKHRWFSDEGRPLVVWTFAITIAGLLVLTFVSALIIALSGGAATYANESVSPDGWSWND